MTKRNEHLFQFDAQQIAMAAKAESDYHDERVHYWKDELQKAVALLKKTAKAEVRQVAATGGSRYDVVLNYGDPAAYRRMVEAQEKIGRHQAARDRFLSDALLYDTQNNTRSYELDADDVAHFRLNGHEREE